ncbi:hypothetical protein C0J52_14150 [Blattella germanica]|nr:hypothetical protein C0J52_14150 [Blattella germanica]
MTSSGEMLLVKVSIGSALGRFGAAPVEYFPCRSRWKRVDLLHDSNPKQDMRIHIGQLLRMKKGNQTHIYNYLRELIVMAFLEPFLLTNKPAPPEFLRPLPKPAPLLAPGRCNGFRAPPPLPPSYPFPGGPYGALYPGPYTPAPRVKLRPEPPQPPKRRALGNFTRGSLIRLASGELRRVEDMRTEDFVTSAERSPALRLDPSTVVRIQECPGGTARLTLSYGEYRTQVRLFLGFYTVVTIRL